MLALGFGIAVTAVVLGYLLFIRPGQHVHVEGSFQAGPYGGLEPHQTYHMEHPNRPHRIPDMMRDRASIERSLRPFSYTTNNRGFRGRDIEMKKGEDVFRIGVVGECVAMGVGVKEDETWPAILEGLLNSLPRATARFEVLNISLGGVPPRQVVINLTEYTKEYELDLVLLAPGSDTVLLPEHIGEPFSLDMGEENYAVILSKYAELLRNATAYCGRAKIPLVFITTTLNSFFLPDGYRWNETMSTVAAELNVPVFNTVEIVEREEQKNGLILTSEEGNQKLVRLVNGVPEILFSVPFVVGTDELHVSQKIYQFLEDNQDIRPRMTIDDNHLTPEGHGIVAQELLVFLDTNKLLSVRLNQ
jgi:hypothetical protein